MCQHSRPRESQGHTQHQRPSRQTPGRQQIADTDAHPVCEQDAEQRQFGQLRHHRIIRLQRHQPEHSFAGHEARKQKKYRCGNTLRPASSEISTASSSVMAKVNTATMSVPQSRIMPVMRFGRFTACRAHAGKPLSTIGDGSALSSSSSPATSINAGGVTAKGASRACRSNGYQPDRAPPVRLQPPPNMAGEISLAAAPVRGTAQHFGRPGYWTADTGWASGRHSQPPRNPARRNPWTM